MLMRQKVEESHPNVKISMCTCVYNIYIYVCKHIENTHTHANLSSQKKDKLLFSWAGLSPIYFRITRGKNWNTSSQIPSWETLETELKSLLPPWFLTQFNSKFIKTTLRHESFSKTTFENRKVFIFKSKK